jgi:excisionase family DNA binding protein
MLYTVEQVADILQVSPQTVRRLIKEGQIKAVRVGIQLRVKKEELDRYLESQST